MASKSELVKKYEEDGFLIIRNVLNQVEIKHVQVHFEWLQTQNPHIDPMLLEHYLMRDDPFWCQLIGHKSLLDIVEQFLGPNIASYASHYVCKPPIVGGRLHWHQDGSYWPLEPMKVLSVWLAVDQSTRENGCMRVVRGSHKEGLKSAGMDAVMFAQHVKEVHKGKETSLMDQYIVPEDIVDVELNPGDISIHSPFMIHGSEPNTSEKRRCGLTIRYIPTSTQVVLGEETMDSHARGSVYLLRGTEDPEVNNPYRKFPKYVHGKHFPFPGCEKYS